MLRVARSRGVEAVLGVGEGDLPFRSDAFDYVLLIVALCFVDEPAVLQEAARVAKPGGALAACIVARDNMWAATTSGNAATLFYTVARLYTAREIEAIMREAGLIVEAYSSVPRFPPWAELRAEEPEPTPKGGFACIKARRSQPPFSRAASAR